MISTITSTVPALLNTLIAPLAETATLVMFGVGAAPGVPFRFEVNGRGASAGYTVTKL